MGFHFSHRKPLVICMNVLLNLEATTSLPLNKNNGRINDNCSIEVILLLKILVSWSVKCCLLNLGKLVFQNNLRTRPLEKYLSKQEHNPREMYVAKKKRKWQLFFVKKQN